MRPKRYEVTNFSLMKNKLMGRRDSIWVNTIDLPGEPFQNFIRMINDIAIKFSLGT